MSERLKHMGRRQEDKVKATGLKMGIEALRASIRDNLDPFDTVEKINGDMVAELAMELAGKLIDYRAVLAEIQQLDEILGR